MQLEFCLGDFVHRVSDENKDYSADFSLHGNPSAIVDLTIVFESYILPAERKK